MRGVIRFAHPPAVLSSAAVVGKTEHEGPCGADFDLHDTDDRFGQPTWEQAEAELQRRAAETAHAKLHAQPADTDAVFAGDLLNQCTASSFGEMDAQIPYVGLYGACSTMAEALMLAAMFVSAGYGERALAVTSSHFCAAERQFRTPIEYGGQRTPTAQRTVTGAGAFLIGKEGAGPYITEALPGIIRERGITDANNMGAAMAPAAADTLTRYFCLTGKTPDSFDAILTGDLGAVGHKILSGLMREAGYEMSRVYNDCGLLIYSRTAQDVHAGGSGCGCSASVLAGPVMKRFARGEWRDILFVGTGALLSPGSTAQGLPIPGIAHLVRISAEKEKSRK